jgi:hypothetical protein
MPDEIDMQMPAGAEGQTVIPRTEPEVSDERRALVERWQSEVRQDKAHHDKAFKQMREDMQVATYGASEQWVDQGNYVVPVVQRHVNQAVAQLYAKNPKAAAKRRQKVDFQYWDGNPQTLEAAYTGAHSMGQMIVQEVMAVKEQHAMLDKIAKGMELLFAYYTSEQQPDFKAQVKQMVRRAKVCGVGYIKLGFQRLWDKNPDVQARIEDTTSKINRLETLLADVADGEIQDGEAELEELRLLMQDLQQQVDIIVREGPVFDFPRATELIPDRRTRQLRNFVGARWVTHEFHMAVDEIKETYEVDIGSSFTDYSGKKPAMDVPTESDMDDGYTTQPERGESGKQQMLACVWEVWDKQNRQVFTIVDGYPDFLREPRTPAVNLERFWPFFALVFNEVESDKHLFPPSDVFMLRHPQQEYNRVREGLREHRIANRPKYFAARGQLEEQDKDNIGNAPAHAVIELNAMDPQTPVNNLIQRHDQVPIDPNLYETGSMLDDILRSVGTQEANIGGTGAETATESSIAENSRMTSLASNVDDLDEMLSELAQATGQLMLMELDQETVRRIAGPGVPWPEMTRQEIAEQIHLEIKAGSSGRPNKAAELANLERGMPYLLQMPGVNPTPLVERYLDLLEIDVEDAIVEGLPSITALNNMMGRGGESGEGAGSGNSQGNGEGAKRPDSDPQQQGSQGGNNAPSTQPRQEGPQPAMPEPNSTIQ